VTSLVLDTTALSHFARADRMDELRKAVADDEPVLVAEVGAELIQGITDYPSLGSAVSDGWLKPVELEELPELAAFARYKGELGGGPERNNGEAAVLAWVTVNGGIAIIDEIVARVIGARERLQVLAADPKLPDWHLRPRHRRSYRGRPHRHRDAPASKNRCGPFHVGQRNRNPSLVRCA
jgi:hypothetical protein